MFLLFEFCCGSPPSCLKVRGWVVASMILVSTPVPMGNFLFLSWVGLAGFSLGVSGNDMTTIVSKVQRMGPEEAGITPLLKWQSGKNFDPRTGILHIVRDP